MSDRVADVLADLVRTYGPDIGLNPRRLRALLSDLAGDAPRKIDVLAAAAEVGATSELRSWSSEAEETLGVRKLVTRLTADGLMDAPTALWALQSWSTALGIRPRTASLAHDPGTTAPINSTKQVSDPTKPVPVRDAAPIGGAGPMAPGGAGNPTPAALPPERPRKPMLRRHGTVAGGVAVLLAVGIGGILLLPRGNKRGSAASSSSAAVTSSSVAVTSSSVAVTSTSVAVTTSSAVVTTTTLVSVGPAVKDPNTAQIQQTLEAYFSGINTRNYQGAWNMFTPGEQVREPLAAFSSQDRVDSDIGIDSIAISAGAFATVGLHFVSRQIPQYSPTNQSCNRWAGAFIMHDEPSGWRIDKSTVRASSC